MPRREASQSGVRFKPGDLPNGNPDGRVHVRFTRTLLVSLTTAGALLAPPSLRAAEDEPADAVRMGLSECLSRALEQNLDLEIAKRDPQIAYQTVLFQEAVFDPLFAAGATHNETKQEPSQVYTGRNNKQDNLNATFSGLLNFGATWSAGLNTSRYDTDSLGALYNPSYNSGLALGFLLPLLKNFGKETTTAQLVISKRSLEISHEELRRQATTTLRAVEDAYWNLRAAREARKVAEQALRLSQDLYELNKKKVEVGTLAPIEITQAEPNPPRIGEPVTLRGSNFGAAEGASIFINGFGMIVDLPVIEWTKDTVTVNIPNDPRLRQDETYYYRITRMTPREGSNPFMFRFDKKVEVQSKIPPAAAVVGAAGPAPVPPPTVVAPPAGAATGAANEVASPAHWPQARSPRSNRNCAPSSREKAARSPC